MSSPYHRPVAAVSATHSHATQNTDASVAGGIGTGITSITDVVLTQAPKFGALPQRGSDESTLTVARHELDFSSTSSRRLLRSSRDRGLPGVLGHPGAKLLYPQAEGRGNVWLPSDS